MDADGAGARLDVFLAAQPEVGSRSRAKDLIARGLVEVLGARSTKAGLALDAGAVVRFRPVFETSPVGRDDPLEMPDVPVLFEDGHLLVIDKPPGMAAHPPSGALGAWREPTVAGWFAARHPDAAASLIAAAADDHTGPDLGLPKPTGGSGGSGRRAPFERPGIVHRLDRDTSGLMLIARTHGALVDLRGQFKRREVVKHYRALSYGRPRFESDWIEKPLAPNPRQGDRVVIARPGEGKQASTFYEVLERFDGFTLFGCRPRTGRTHQIRVHMTSIGHSLVGDRAYRSRNQQLVELPDGAPDPARHCLHAFRLELSHPRTGEEMTFEAPLPDDMARLVEWLRANRASR